MRLLKLLAAALAAALTLPACSLYKRPPTVPLLPPPQPVPAAALALCPPPPMPPLLQAADMDALAMTLKTTYDAYGDCAATHAALVDWVDARAQQKGGKP